MNLAKQCEKVLSLTKKDFRVETFCVGGHGGQNMQKNQTGVRITHPASSAKGESRDERSQLQNKKAAFERLTSSPKFQLWLKVEHAKILDKMNQSNQIRLLRLTKQELEYQVAQQLHQDIEDGNVVFEIKDAEGNWVKE
jgi:protein subunit release factor A